MSTFVKKATSAVAALAIVFSIVSPIAGVSAAFTSLEAANKLSTLGVIVDQSANPADYRLGDNLQRKEGVKVMMNLSSVAVVDNCAGKFSDLKSTDWACKYAETALANGMVAGNATFGSDRLLSKIEALKMVFQGRDLERNDNADWRAGYVDAAVEMGVADAAFSDYDTAVTRGQFFIWAANAVDAEEVAVEGDILCEILGTCEDDTTDPVDPVEPTEPTTPVTGGDVMVSKSPESPSNGLAAVNTPRVAMLAFDVTAGDTDVTLSMATLLHVGLGNRANVQDVTIYNSNNEAVSKTKDFSDADLDLSFDRDIVVQAGTTETFTVAAMLVDDGKTNTTYQVELVALETSASSVKGLGVVGAALTPTEVANAGKLSVKANTASDDITIGEEVTLAGFSVEETEDNEDILIRTITLHQNGSIDADYFEELELLADGKSLGMFSVNSDDELVMNIDYVLAADDRVDFEVVGMVTGDVGETVHFQFEGTDDIYATGVSTKFNIGFNTGDLPNETDANVANEEEVDGAEIDAVFTKSDIDESKVDVDDVLVGTLKLTANSNDYEVTKIQVTVGGTAGVAAVSDMFLDGQAYDSVVGNVYTFEDITLTQGVTEVLPLEFDVNDNIGLNGRNVEFTIKIVEIEDDENNVTYTVGGSDDVNDVLSSNAFTKKSIDIETASVELTQTKVNNRELVLANGVETVLFKGKLSVGDSDSVSLERMKFIVASPNDITDLEDIIDTVELNIGGTVFTESADTTSIEFSSLSHEIAAGSDNVEVLVTAILQDDDGITSGSELYLVLDTANLEFQDSDNEDVTNVDTNLVAYNPATTTNTVTTVIDRGAINVAVTNNTDYDDEIDDVVLGGTAGVYLAGLEIEAEYEDISVDEMIFRVDGQDVSTSFNAMKLVSSEDGTIADDAVVTYDGTNTLIKFKDFVIPGNDEVTDYALMADLNAIDNTGDADAVTAATVSIAFVSIDADGAESNEDIVATTVGNVASDDVNIVPVTVMISVATADELSEDEETATVLFTLNKGNNVIDNDDVILKSFEFTSASDTDKITLIENDDGTDLANTVA